MTLKRGVNSKAKPSKVKIHRGSKKKVVEGRFKKKEGYKRCS
jgi:hypothetical protein